MSKFYYHATPASNLIPIVVSGEIHTGYDGIVYLAESEQDALKFIAIRCFEEIVIFKIKVPDESKIVETFDHSYDFFKCKSFGYAGNIPTSCIQCANKYGAAK